MRTQSTLIFGSLVMSVLCAALSTIESTGSANEALRINAQGAVTNLGIWLYRTKDGGYGHGDATVGTNEALIMPAPSPPPDGTVAGVLIKRHPFDNLGYPLHIALVEKSFGEFNKIDVIVDDNSGIWSHNEVARLSWIV